MSFDFNNNNHGSFEDNSNSANPAENTFHFDFDAIRQRSSQQDNIPEFAAAAMGVYYYRKFLLTWLLFFLFIFVCLFLMVFIAAVLPEIGSILLGVSYIIAYFAFIIYGIICYCRSMSAFCRIPQTLIPNARSTILKSWGAWLVLIVICIIFQIITPDNPSNNIAPSELSGILLMVAAILGIVFYVACIYSYVIFARLFCQIKQVATPSNTPGCLVVAFFVFFYYLVLLYYSDNLYQFFSQKYGYTRIKYAYRNIKNEKSSESRFSCLLISLLVFTLICLIILIPVLYSSVNSNMFTPLTFEERRVLQEYAAIENSILKEEATRVDQYVNEQITDSQLDSWITNSSLPKWQSAAEILSNSRLNNSPTIKEFQSINDDRIEYCKLFKQALKLQTEESFTKAFQKYVHTNLRVFIFTKKDKIISIDEAQDGLNKAIFVNDEEMVKWFIKKGANVNRPDSDGQTPIQYAKKYKNTNIVKILEEYGADAWGVQKDYNLPIDFLPIDANSSENIDSLILDSIQKDTNLSTKTDSQPAQFDFKSLQIDSEPLHIDSEPLHIDLEPADTNTQSDPFGTLLKNNSNPFDFEAIETNSPTNADTQPEPLDLPGLENDIEPLEIDSEPQPEQMDSQPEQAETQQEQTEPQPEQTEAQPEQTETQPEQAETQQEQTEAQPEQTETQPEQTEAQPEQTEPQPEQTEEQTEQTDSQPEQTEKQPEQTETQPEQEDSQPE